jgi:hypothetical protein
MLQRCFPLKRARLRADQLGPARPELEQDGKTKWDRAFSTVNHGRSVDVKGGSKYADLQTIDLQTPSGSRGC